MACCLTTPSHCLYRWRPTNWYKWYWYPFVHVLQIIMPGFNMDICVSPCLWSHPHLRLTSHHFPYKVIMQMLVHAFHITIPTFLYVYVYACLWVCNSLSHVHIYVSHIFIKMPNHLEGVNPMQPSDATQQQLGPSWLRWWLAAWWQQAIAWMNGDLQIDTSEMGIM